MDERSMMHRDDVVAFVKPAIDVHTLGMANAESILSDCGMRVVSARPDIEAALERPSDERNANAIKSWLAANHVDHLGFSYRLDPSDGVALFRELYAMLREGNLLKEQGGSIRKIFFSGLPDACAAVEQAIPGRVKVIRGGETPSEFLEIVGMPQEIRPAFLVAECRYDLIRDGLAKEFLASGMYESRVPPERSVYPEFGTRSDTLIKRLACARKAGSLPLTRSHVGPFYEDRVDALRRFGEWIKDLATAGYLDVLSIGSSQLTQSHFERDWHGLKNGGGVPIRTREEFFEIYERSRPMLVRTYAGTDRIPELAEIYEDTINIAWHALSFWWFNTLDGRGPLGLLKNLEEHFKAVDYIATTGKPLEANVSHHFAFRGSDDVSYIVSNVLAARAAKLRGIKTFVVQNMLNTPRLTWGTQDLAKARALLSILRELENDCFRLVYETRAGLSYFSSDIEIAKRQLVSVSFLMDDVDPWNESSPEIVHVVGYSEANYLANPSVINESVRMTLSAIDRYRELRRRGDVPDMSKDVDVMERTERLRSEAIALLQAMERHIPGLYSPQGFYECFKQGWLPVPELWGDRALYPNATGQKVKLMNGGFWLVDGEGKPLAVQARIERILGDAR